MAAGALAVAAVLLLAACGDEQVDPETSLIDDPVDGTTDDTTGDDTTDDDTADAAAEPMLQARCGSVVFSALPPDLDEFPPLDEDTAGAIEVLTEGPTGVEALGFGTDVDWSVAARTDDELVLFGQQRSADGGFVDARFDRRDDQWSPRNWGGCTIGIEAPGFGPASVGVDPGTPIDPAATELEILINERACAGGQAPVDREVLTVVGEDEESITITAVVAPVEGGANCPGNPWHPVTVSLDAPVGDRQLLDGGQHPPIPVATAGLEIDE